MTDVEIARNTPLQPISKIAEKLEIPEDQIEYYGTYKAKILSKYEMSQKDKPNAKLILITSIHPTPLGEGKTTISIGLADGLNRIGKKAVLALREPSLGPVFGIKGGATGGGYAQVAPMEEINLHFTGDIHAITSANNLLSAMIDNHIYYGNKLGIDRVTWKRCMDLNDRQLRKVNTGLSGEKNTIPREDGFDITVASEIMAIFCLATDLADLKRRLANIVIGYTKENVPITASDLKAEGAMTVLLKDAFSPNLVQTLEHNPALIHGGPFANIAHGCNSIIATKMALKLGEYVVTEAGFGADLGAEKFMDIKCRKANLKPDTTVCVATIKALKYHGGMEKEELSKQDRSALTKGLHNLLRHIDNLKNQFGQNVIVAINQYDSDTEEEIQMLKDALEKEKVELSLVEAWKKGGEGAIDLANKVVTLCNKPSIIKFAYELEDSIVTKIEKVAKNIYGASQIEITKQAQEEIRRLEALGYGNLPICMAKTQYSFSDDAKNLECKEDFSIHVTDVIVKAGAEFIVVLTGKVMTMPGLPKMPAAEQIDINEQGNIVGIF